MTARNIKNLFDPHGQKRPDYRRLARPWLADCACAWRGGRESRPVIA